VTAEDLFLQFRERREPSLLGAVFDLVSDELFGVAMHVCSSHADAEDLVQATFLVAMERADRYQPGRPLRPWLLGILHQEAKASRRRARRAPDAERLTPSPSPAPRPLQSALDAEAMASVSDALAGVQEPYREVVELHLIHSCTNLEIADRLRRSPGAVRTQLWRGLGMLRGLLPRGLATAVVAHVGLSWPGSHAGAAVADPRRSGPSRRRETWTG
jgi:RNA polymerase sigma-70 factor (ECF subfamily)